MNNLSNNEFAAVCLTEAANILNEVSDASLAGIAITLLAASVGGIIWNYKDDKKKEKELENKRNEEKELQNKKISDTYIIKIGNEISQIKISSKDDLIKRIIIDINKCCTVAKNDSKIKQKIRDSIKEAKDNHDLNNDECKYRMGGCKFDQYKTDDYLEVINGDQMIRAYLGWLLDDIKIVLERKWGKLLKEYDIKIGTGDGDEGCIYFD